MSVDAYGIHLGPLYVRFYGILIVIGLLLGASLAAWMAKRDRRDPDHIWGGLTWALIPGIIGARLWFIFFPSISMVERGFTPEWFLTHPFDLTNGPLAIWNGGLGIFGAVVGGVLGILLYARRYRLPLLEWLDIAAVALPIGQAVGRWGNFINQELYGPPTTLPWGIPIPSANRIEPYTLANGYGLDTLFHPLFLYESLWNALSVVILLYLWLNFRKRFKRGDFLLLYLISYSFIRFMLEFLRVEVTLVNSINVSQVTTGIAGVIAVIILLYRHRPGAAHEQIYEANPGAVMHDVADEAEEHKAVA
ncbi:MAG: prolipoprotein diacylglyceryl transferase [Anaerolineae bacterium]|nr:prolipoprotein diacylglyceryl transferase [Anaerolineae bacterium]